MLIQTDALSKVNAFKYDDKNYYKPFENLRPRPTGMKIEKLISFLYKAVF